MYSTDILSIAAAAAMTSEELLGYSAYTK